MAGLLGQMFDGILRPLEQIKEVAGGIYIPRGLTIPALPRDVKWDFIPAVRISVCDLLFVPSSFLFSHCLDL